MDTDSRVVRKIPFAAVVPLFRYHRATSFRERVDIGADLDPELRESVPAAMEGENLAAWQDRLESMGWWIDWEK
jgi:hypothetical protein